MSGAEEVDLKKMKVHDLRAALLKRGLPTEGKKADLLSRLQARLDEEEFMGVDDMGVSSSGGGASDGPTAGQTTGEPSSIVEDSADPRESVAHGNNNDPNRELEQLSSAKTLLGLSKSDSTELKKDETNSKKVSFSKAMTFAEKKKARALRFGIPLVNEKRSEAKGGVKKTPKEKREQPSAPKNKNSESKKQKTEVVKEVLTKEEIEARLKRAEKYGTTDNVEALKAQLRQYRFAVK